MSEPGFRGKNGRVYPVSRFHTMGGRIALCPVCNARPCTWDCPEQLLPDLSGDAANTAAAQAANAPKLARGA